MPDRDDFQVRLAEYENLGFKPGEIVVTNTQAWSVARVFWPKSPIRPDALTQKDLAFIQAALIIAIDTSYVSPGLCNLLTSHPKGFTKLSGPIQVIVELVKMSTKKSVKKWFHYAKDHDLQNPKINALGIASVQSSFFITEWRDRVALESDEHLRDFQA